MKLILVLAAAAAAHRGLEYAFEVGDELAERADSSTESESSSIKITLTATETPTTRDSSSHSESSSASSTATGDSSDDSSSGKETKKSSSATSSDPTSSTDSVSEKSTSSTSSGKTSISVNPADPAGAAVLVEPTSTSSTYVKSGQKVTFKWSYTNLVNTPDYINIEAVCSTNGQTYTIAHRQSPKQTSAVWDTKNAADNSTGGVHLITADYELQIYDSNSSVSAVASAGALGSLTYAFGVYIPQKYVPWPKNDNYVNSGLSHQGVVATVLGGIVVLCISLL